MNTEKILLILFIIFAVLALPFYLYIIIRFAGEAISKTIKFFKEETNKNKEK